MKSSKQLKPRRRRTPQLETGRLEMRRVETGRVETGRLEMRWVETGRVAAPCRPMGRQTATPEANQGATKSCLSSGGSPSPGPSRPSTGTGPRWRTLSSRRRLPPWQQRLLLGAASRTPTKADHCKDLRPQGPGALDPGPAPCSDHQEPWTGSRFTVTRQNATRCFLHPVLSTGWRSSSSLP